MQPSVRSFTARIAPIAHVLAAWRRLNRYVAWIALPLLTLPAVWRLATAPFFLSDDGILHVWRLHGLDDALRQGVLFPRIFPWFAFGYGHPVLGYYGPLSYYFAEVIHLLGADFPDAIKLTFVLGYLASGYTAYLLARRFVSLAPALLGAVAYVYAPYHLVDTFQRGALAEHLAWVYLPLILWSITPAQNVGPVSGSPAHSARHSVVFILATAGLICTHNLTALMFMPCVLLYYALVSRGVRLRERVGHIALPLAGALAISAFYWLPIALQTGWVQISDAPRTFDYTTHIATTATLVQDSFFFAFEQGQGFPDHPLALVDFLLWMAALLMLAQQYRTKQQGMRMPAFFIGLTLAALFMTVDFSAPVWDALRSILAFVQYPWRFMMLAGLGVALCGVFAFREHPRLALLAIPVLIVSVMPGPRFRAAPDAPSDLFSMWRYEFRERLIGSTWTEEYMPWWVQADTAAIPRLQSRPVSDVTSGAPQLDLVAAGYTFRRYRVHLDAPATIRFHQFYFPQWRVALDGRALQTLPSTDLGLLSVDLPSTPDGILEVDFESTLAEQWGTYLSIAACLAVLSWFRGQWLIAWVPPAAVLAAALALTAEPAAAIRPVHAQVEDMAQLVSARWPAGPFHPGDSLSIVLTWLAQRETRENLTGFVHLQDASTGRIIVQTDSAPVGGYTPTSQWRTGELIEDLRVLTIPVGAPPGTLRIVAGLYRNPPPENLSVMQNGQPVGDGRIQLGTLQVIAR